MHIQFLLVGMLPGDSFYSQFSPFEIFSCEVHLNQGPFTHHLVYFVLEEKKIILVIFEA